MPTTTAITRSRDMTPVHAGRRRQAAAERLDKAIAEIIAQGWTRVILIGPGEKTVTYTRP